MVLLNGIIYFKSFNIVISLKQLYATLIFRYCNKVLPLDLHYLIILYSALCGIHLFLIYTHFNIAFFILNLRLLGTKGFF